MSEDIHPILSKWPHGEGSNLRRITGDDGREKIQIRICIDSFHGLLQLECDGRPDGKRPHGCEFLLDYLEAKCKRFTDAGGHEEQFRLTRTQCKRLFDEGNLVYHRYVLLLQMGDFARVIRDTSRNMRLFRFVHRHAMHASDRTHLECWWPYLSRIHFTALVMERISQGQLHRALETLQTCRERLRALPAQDNEVFKTEMNRSLEALTHMEKEIRARMPKTELEELEHAKAEAIQKQRYEEAARLRDKILALRARPAGHAPPAPEPAGN